VLSRLKRNHDGAVVPRIVFTKGGGPWLEEMGGLDCEVLGLDWTVNLARARALVGNRKALQGNLDPNILFAQPAQIEAEAAKVLDSFGTPHVGAGNGPSHIFNLGHGISQHTPPDHVQALVNAVHTHSRRLRTQAAS
jgi:uroporphyrinogen decarboxylase